MPIKFAAVASLALIFVPFMALAEEKAAPQPPAAQAPPATPGIKRTVLQKFDVAGTNLEVTMMKVEFEPNFEVQRHTHPGNEASYIQEGDITLVLEGEEPKQLQAGGTTYFPAGLAHGGKVGLKGVTLINTYVLEKGKPFMTKVEAAK